MWAKYIRLPSFAQIYPRAEHKRQFARVTNADKAIEEQARAFHIGDEPPKVSQMIYANYTDGKGLQKPC